MSLAQETRVLSFFYAKHADNERNLFLSFLPESLQKQLVQQKKIPFSEKTLNLQTLFSFFHPSHITDYLSTLEPQEAKIFLSALKEPIDPSYIQTLNLKSFTPLSLNPTYNTFLLSLLFKKICSAKNFLAQEFFKNEEFIHLLYLDFNAFNRLLQVLAMYDIHIELHTVISTAQIKTLTKALNEDQCLFLKNIRSERKEDAFFPMGLKSFDGNHTKLSLILRQRSLNRLAKALSTQPQEFLNQLYFRLSSVEKRLFSKLLLVYQNKEFNTEQEHLKNVISFIQG